MLKIYEKLKRLVDRSNNKHFFSFKRTKLAPGRIGLQFFKYVKNANLPKKNWYKLVKNDKIYEFMVF